MVAGVVAGALGLGGALGGCGASAAPPQAAAPAPAKSVQLNAPGALVDVDAALPAGYVTVVDFWGEHCGACEVVGGMLAVQVAKDDRVVIRKVDVGDGFTPVAQHYKIGALPHFRLYDKRKQLRYVLVGNDCLEGPRARQAARARAVAPPRRPRAGAAGRAHSPGMPSRPALSCIVDAPSSCLVIGW